MSTSDIHQTTPYIEHKLHEIDMSVLLRALELITNAVEFMYPCCAKGKVWACDVARIAENSELKFAAPSLAPHGRDPVMMNEIDLANWGITTTRNYILSYDGHNSKAHGSGTCLARAYFLAALQRTQFSFGLVALHSRPLTPSTS